MKFFITIFLLSVIVFGAGCDSSANKNKSDVNERVNTFAAFTEFTVAHYPDWTVEGLRKDETVSGDDGTDKVFYYVLLKKDKTEKIVFLVMADFETLDGTTETRIFEPSQTTLKQLQNKQVLDKEQKVDYSEVDPPRAAGMKGHYAQINAYKTPILTATFLIPVLAWVLFPAPYNPSYLVKRALLNPSAVCRDGIYSFSSSRSGTCSNHGGVKKWIPKNQD